MARIVVVVTGGVWAPSGFALAERFQREGHDVRLLATRPALLFLANYLIRNLGKLRSFLKLWQSPLSELFCYFSGTAGKVAHINTPKWSDIIVVAPATCNSVGKIVGGISDNFPLLVVRAETREKKVLVAPSMNPEMWFDPFTQENIERLNRTEKYVTICPAYGMMKSGDFGIGIMASLDEIVQQANELLRAEANENQSESGGVGEPETNVHNLSDRRSDKSNGNDFRSDQRVAIIDKDGCLASDISAAINRRYPDFHVSCFPDAASFVEAASELKAGVVITDLDLDAGHTGTEFIQTLLRDTCQKQTVTIAISNRDRFSANAERLSQLGVQFIPKPIKVDYVVSMVAGALNGQHGPTSADEGSDGEVRR